MMQAAVGKRIRVAFGIFDSPVWAISEMRRFVSKSAYGLGSPARGAARGLSRIPAVEAAENSGGRQG